MLTLGVNKINRLQSPKIFYVTSYFAQIINLTKLGLYHKLNYLCNCDIYNSAYYFIQYAVKPLSLGGGYKALSYCNKNPN